jgi:hypothetical protein
LLQNIVSRGHEFLQIILRYFLLKRPVFVVGSPNSGPAFDAGLKAEMGMKRMG